MDKSFFINIACGDSYIKGWQNYDYLPSSEFVQRADLLGKLPVASNEAEFVYSSHFLEHIPVSKVDDFLAECYRIIKPSGYIRLVLPDLEELCRSYLEYREQGQHDKANFLVLEIFDQCVRTQPGGELGLLYNNLLSTNADKRMIEFVKHRTGYSFDKGVSPTSSRVQLFFKNPAKLISKLEQIYIKLILGFLPSAFVQQNVSMALIGERHAWGYDFHSVEQLLYKAGFTEINKVTCSSSAIAEFPFYPLDIDIDGNPRKGVGSMYIEALKR